MKTLVKIKNNKSITRFRVQHITLYEIYFNVKLDVSYYWLLKCDAWHVISKNVKDQKKLNDRNIKYKLIKYEKIHQYRLWNSIFRRVIIFKNVEFDELYMFVYFNKAFYWNENLKFFRIENIAFFESDFDYVSMFENNDLNDISRLNVLIKQSLNFQKTVKSLKNDDFIFLTFLTFAKPVHNAIDQND